MIEGIWQEIWKRIEHEPERLKQEGFFFDPNGTSKFWIGWVPEVGFAQECGTACCLAGHAIMIAREKGYDISKVETLSDFANHLLGERDLSELFFCMDERVVRHYIECRAKGVWGDS